jgi:hypothetical protein
MGATGATADMNGTLASETGREGRRNDGMTGLQN